MKIHELFIKPVERPIEGVIKADDSRNLQNELEEYVITRDVAKGLNVFTERYLEELTANGVWISGFFGSGKSHLLKILSLVLDSAALSSGVHPAKIILPKIEDEIVKANLQKAASIPSRSLLFNIDQKFDGIGGNPSSAILEVFIKVLNEEQGYFGKQRHIAKFERDLDERGEFTPFKQTYLRLNGSEWEKDREAISTARRAAFTKAYSEHFGVPESEAANVLRQVREDYRESIESFAQMVKSYIDKKPPGFRLNFFVDEVGQFIGSDSQRMLNLQTIAETLATVCKGRAWVFVTSQADLQSILGEYRGMEAQDMSKIMGRFKTQLTLASADVREVIQERLLAKKEKEPEVLTAIYDREKDNLETLYRFGDNSVVLKGWRGSDEFCAFYPFHTYQFDLFQKGIVQLAVHDVFIGRFQSVGERSMLGVFQEVAKTIRNKDVGHLAPFDLMYDGISASIRGDVQNSIQVAENQLGDGLPLRILKALFLLKWVREFKASPRNVAILLIDRPDIDIRAHEKAVNDALVLLESQSYLQRNGELYEFLTDTERDIENEIKNTEIDDAQVVKILNDILFVDVIRDAKIRYEGNGQDYPYSRKIDDQLIGKEADVAMNLITTDHPNHSNVAALAAQNTGKAELLGILPSDLRLIEQVRAFLKTQKYIQQNTGTSDESRKAILEHRSQQNSFRRSAIAELASEILGKVPLYLNGTRLEVNPGDARNRFAKAAQELISYSFPSLKMLKGAYDETTLSAALLEPPPLPGVYTLTEADQEVYNYVQRNQDSGERTSVESMLREFSRRPYGWPQMAVLTLIARLFRVGKLELRAGEPLDARAALEHLTNSRKHGALKVRLQENFDASKINALKGFYHDFFDRPLAESEARAIGQGTATAFAAEAQELATLVAQVGRYKFLEPLRALADQIKKMSGRDYTYFINNLADFKTDLLDAKENIISPIKAFMNGPQRNAYDDAIEFLTAEAANFSELPASDVQPLRDLAVSEYPYRGNTVPNAKAAISKLRGQIDTLIKSERQDALEKIKTHEERLMQVPDFIALTDQNKQQVLAKSGVAREEIKTSQFVNGIRDRLNRYTNIDYPAQLDLASRLAKPAAKPTGHTPAETTVISIPVSKLNVQCSLPYIANKDQLEKWLEALRMAAQEELDKGKRISL